MCEGVAVRIATGVVVVATIGVAVVFVAVVVAVDTGVVAAGVVDDGAPDVAALLAASAVPAPPLVDAPRLEPIENRLPWPESRIDSPCQILKCAISISKRCPFLKRPPLRVRPTVSSSSSSLKFGKEGDSQKMQSTKTLDLGGVGVGWSSLIL